MLGIPTIESHYEGLNFWDSYHSTSDTRETCLYDDDAFKSSHVLYGTILQKLDELVVRPLHFENLFQKMNESIDDKIITDDIQNRNLRNHIQNLIDINEDILLRQKRFSSFSNETREFNLQISAISKIITEELFGLDWYETYDFIHVRNQNNIRFIRQAICHIEEQTEISIVMEDLKKVDLCWYAYYFDKSTYQELVNQVLGEHTVDSWGSGKVTSIVDLFDTCKLLTDCAAGKEVDKKNLSAQLKAELQRQEKELYQKIAIEISILERIAEMMKSADL